MNLTGTWKCNDGGLYFIRQIDNEIWWYGEQHVENSMQPEFTNVLHGTICSSKINAEWSDIPLGKCSFNGTITLEIINDCKLRKVSFTGQFGGSVWKKE
jgi:hypothetical protein